jgi:mono/diheme cytochrome c family protein
MSTRALNALLAALFLGSFGVMWASRRDVHQPNWEIFPDMAHAPRANAFSENAVFPDGKTLQAPPAGTIPRGWLPLHYAATAADQARAGAELRNPFARDAAQALARGEQLFTNFCAPCHGAGGEGNGPVATRGVPPPPSLVTGRATGLPDGQLFHILTYGQNNMASYATQLSREDRWRVILYVRSLQRSALQRSAPPPAGQP